MFSAKKGALFSDFSPRSNFDQKKNPELQRTSHKNFSAKFKRPANIIQYNLAWSLDISSEEYVSSDLKPAMWHPKQGLTLKAKAPRALEKSNKVGFNKWCNCMHDFLSNHRGSGKFVNFRTLQLMSYALAKKIQWKCCQHQKHPSCSPTSRDLMRKSFHSSFRF